MGLNPSNGIAQAMNPQAHVFPNLARRGDWADPEINAIVKTEFEQAGIKVDDYRFKLSGEVPTSIIGSAHGWIFSRAWYYYVAKGPGVPPDRAEEFHKTWGTQVRVDGHCGCPSPLEHYHGFAVGTYHIDTQEGLNAFVALLGSIYIV